jgi:GNAT superfamily N-acetyltransferase
LDLVSATAIEKEVYAKAAWSAGQFKEEFAKAPKTAHYLAAEFEGNLIAYAGIFYVADVADIHTITVAADHQRKGIGRELLKRLIDWARVKKAKAIWVAIKHTKFYINCPFLESLRNCWKFWEKVVPATILANRSLSLSQTCGVTSTHLAAAMAPTHIAEIFPVWFGCRFLRTVADWC